MAPVSESSTDLAASLTIDGEGSVVCSSNLDPSSSKAFVVGVSVSALTALSSLGFEDSFSVVPPVAAFFFAFCS